MPELAMMLVTDLAVLDHADGTVLLDRQRRCAASPPAATTTPSPGSTRWPRDLAKPPPPSVATLDLDAAPEVRAAHHARATTRPAVEAVQEHIRAGDAFQVVLCQRFEVAHRRRRARRLPGAAGQQPVAVHVPAALRRPRVARTTSWGPRPRRW